MKFAGRLNAAAHQVEGTQDGTSCLSDFDEDAGVQRTYAVNSVLRAASILKSFSHSSEVLELREIAARVGLAKPTAFRLLNTLVEADLVARTGRTGYRTCVHINRSRPFRIGYCAQSQVVPFTSAVTESLTTAADRANITLLTLNNGFSATRALQNATYLVKERVDLVINSQLHTRVAPAISAAFLSASIPFIAVDIPHPGAIYFGADNYKAGRAAGLHLGRWSQKVWKGEVDHILLLRAEAGGPTLNSRLDGMLNGISEFVRRDHSVPITHLDTKGQFERTLDAVRKFLRLVKPRHALVGAVNDISALAALQAFRDMGMEKHCALAGQDACLEARNEMRRKDTRFVCSVAYFPERYGEELIKLSLDILYRKNVPSASFIKHELVTPDNVDRIYPNDVWTTTPAGYLHTATA